MIIINDINQLRFRVLFLNRGTVLILLEAGAAVDTKNAIGKTASMLCGFVGQKQTHRILNCWVDDTSFLKARDFTSSRFFLFSVFVDVNNGPVFDTVCQVVS